MAYFVGIGTLNWRIFWKIMKICLVHDLEAFYRGYPSFWKTVKDSEKEADVLGEWWKLYRNHLIKRWQNCIRKWKHNRLWNPESTSFGQTGSADPAQWIRHQNLDPHWNIACRWPTEMNRWNSQIIWRVSGAGEQMVCGRLKICTLDCTSPSEVLKGNHFTWFPLVKFRFYADFLFTNIS